MTQEVGTHAIKDVSVSPKKVRGGDRSGRRVVVQDAPQPTQPW